MFLQLSSFVTLLLYNSCVLHSHQYTKDLADAKSTLSPLLNLLVPSSSSSYSSRASTPTVRKPQIFFPNSPCPSPTPLFQQLYMALAHFERMSPDFLTLLKGNDLGKLVNRRNSLTNVSADEESPSACRRKSFPPFGRAPEVRITSASCAEES